jgi:D-amino-acid oxidase
MKTPSKRHRVVVVGAGVIGLTTATVLAEAGFDVSIISKSLDNVSRIAAAFWYPYNVQPLRECVAWSDVSLQIFRKLAQQKPDTTGIVFREARVLDSIAVDRDRLGIDCDAASNLAVHHPIGGIADQVVASIPTLEMPTYLNFLTKNLGTKGVFVQSKFVVDLEELFSEFDCNWVVNCAGIGARELAEDREVFGMRGQLIHYHGLITQEYQFTIDFSSLSRPTYIVPRNDYFVLGGTCFASENVEVSQIEFEDIFMRCKRFVPSLRQNLVVKSVVGIRPCRHSVRCEKEQFKSGIVIHNYGHGGAGVTLSWGCAQEVLQLICRDDTSELKME